MNGLDSLSLQLWRCTGSSGYWGLISFVSDCYFQPPSNPSLSCSLSTMTFPFLSLIVWSTIICPLLDKWPEYYEGANLCGIYNAVGGGNDLHCHQSKSSLFLSTYKAFIIHIVDQIRKKKMKILSCSATIKSSIMSETIYMTVQTVEPSSIISRPTGSGHFLPHWQNCIVLIIKWKTHFL